MGLSYIWLLKFRLMHACKALWSGVWSCGFSLSGTGTASKRPHFRNLCSSYSPLSLLLRLRLLLLSLCTASAADSNHLDVAEAPDQPERRPLQKTHEEIEATRAMLPHQGRRALQTRRRRSRRFARPGVRRLPSKLHVPPLPTLIQ